ncbi:unnamed protein product [Coregonus sp. 'balchen']|nr:unnamed protein product [Coregonus sp. 'balchen']
MANHAFPLHRTVIKHLALEILKESGRTTIVNLEQGLSDNWCVFGPLKSVFTTNAARLGLVWVHVVIGKKHFSAMLHQAYPKAVSSENIKGGFRKAPTTAPTSVTPAAPTAAPTAVTPTNPLVAAGIVSVKLANAYMPIILANKFGQQQQPTVRRRLPLPAQVITADDFNEMLIQQDKEEAKQRRQEELRRKREDLQRKKEELQRKREENRKR